MPVFKKPKFAGGGGLQGLFNNPGLGLGLEYIPTQQELPDLEGIMYVEKAKQEARSQLEGLRKEYTPDVSLLTAELDDMEMFSNVKSSIKREITEEVAKFKRDVQDDPDYAFSMDARHRFTQIQNQFKASNYDRHALRYKESEKDFTAAKAAGLGNEMYVKNGQVPVMDSKNPSKIQMVSAEKAGEMLNDPNNAGRYYVPRSSDEIYDWQHKFADSNFNNYFTFSGRSTANDAYKEIESVFKNVASSTFDTIDFDDITQKSGVAVYNQLKSQNKSNAEQLITAMTQVRNRITSSSLDAIKAEYYKQFGDFTNKGFNEYFNTLLSGEAMMRSNEENTLTSSNSVLTGENQDRLQPAGGNLGVPVPTDPGMFLSENSFLSEWGGQDGFYSPTIAGSSNPRDLRTYEQKVFSGNKFIYNNDYRGNSKAQGFIKSGDKTLYGSIHRGDYLIPISTGQVIEKVDEGYSIREDHGMIKPDRMLSAKEGSNIYQTGKLKIKNLDGLTKTVNGIDYLVYEATDGKSFIVASPKAFSVHHGYQTKDQNKGDETVVFQSLNPTQSIQSFSNSSFALNYKQQKFFDDQSKELSTEGMRLKDDFIENIDNQISQIDNVLLNKLSPGQSKQYNDQRLNLENNKLQIKERFDYLQAVKNGQKKILTSEDEKDYEQVMFTLHMLLNTLKDEGTIQTVAKTTTTVNNALRSNSLYNNISR